MLEWLHQWVMDRCVTRLGGSAGLLRQDDFWGVEGPRRERVGGAFWDRTRFWPISVRAQVVFAAAASQAIDAGLTVKAAFEAAADVSTSSRMRVALHRAAKDISAGYPLSECLQRSEYRVSQAMLYTLDVSETPSRIAEELRAYSLRTDAHTTSLLPQIIGRSTQAIQFAQAMSRLLRDRAMTVPLVGEASMLVEPRTKSFARTMDDVIEKIDGGGSLGEALSCHPRHFDPLYCACVGATDSRSNLQRVFEVLSM